ncbi:MAG: recombinase family protein, partial [Chloroflexi bacterium]|nr:recombinase family protein [Chloroflexota bacterium]
DGSVSRCGGGLFDEGEFQRWKRYLKWELEWLLIPAVDEAKEAGRLLADMPRLWAGATLQERHQLLTTILDAVYIDMKGSKSILSVKLKPVFQAVLGATSQDRVDGVALVAR